MMFVPNKTWLTALALTAGLLVLGSAGGIRAEPATEIRVTYANGQFQPAGLSAPADKPLVIRVKNLDNKAMEFESTSLRVEKVVPAKSEGVINVRPLKQGRYEFYDDFNDKARGVLNAQ
jgi:hypothetical protein